LALRRAALVHPHACACGYWAGRAVFPLLSLARPKIAILGDFGPWSLPLANSIYPPSADSRDPSALHGAARFAGAIRYPWRFWAAEFVTINKLRIYTQDKVI
jgi:hypothetical protein